MGGGGKIPFPRHVWSPSGGWYFQPKNWKQNTAVMAAMIAGIAMVSWSVSARLEHRDKMPEPDRFFPSRNWSKQIKEYERERKAE